MRPFATLWFSDADVMRSVGIFFRRRWLFIVPAVAGLVIGVVLGGLLPKIYEASTIILVDEAKIMNPLIEGLAVSTPAAQRLRTLREEILSWDRLVRLMEQLQIAKDVQNQGELEKRIQDLRKEIIVQMRGPNLVRIAYQAPDPARAQQVVKAVMAMFIDENVKAQTKEAGVAIDFLQGQLKVYRRKIKESEIASMEDDLNRLKIDSTEAHPMVVQLREKIARTREEMDTVERTDPPPRPIPDPLFEQIRRQVMANQAQGVAAVPEIPPGMDPQLFNLYVLMSRATTESNDASVNTHIYNQLLTRLETARMTQQLDASKEGTRYTVLDPPRMPLKPVRPNRLLVAFLGALLGAMAGVGSILLMEMADRSFHAAEEVAQYLQLPVVGAINAIWTNSEVQSRKVQQRFATMAISGLVATVLLGSLIIGWIHG